MPLKDKIANRLSRYPLYESYKIRTQNHKGFPPILIYQMGKVGSATVRETLIGAKLPNPIYHIHFLSHVGIKNAEDFFLSLKMPIKSNHLRRSKVLRKIIDKTTQFNGKS